MENLDDLHAFVQVAQSGSFTKAAAQLGISQSTLSHTIKQLEARLGVKLFNRSTRSIAPTAAGGQLLADLEPLLAQIGQKLLDLNAFRATPHGHLRLNASDLAARYVLWPKLSPLLRQYPEISVEIVCEVRYADIVAERFDAGVRLGSLVDKDMVAVRISPDIDMCLAAAPAYLAERGTPQNPDDLAAHTAIAMRLPTLGDSMVWEFVHPQNGKTVNFRPNGRITANNSDLLIQAAVSAQGLVWLPRFMLAPELAAGRLTGVLEAWAAHYPGYHLYYPSRRSDSPLFQALVEAVRHREA